jgi:membrane fusion protein (multidrug efflux system)
LPPPRPAKAAVVEAENRMSSPSRTPSRAAQQKLVPGPGTGAAVGQERAGRGQRGAVPRRCRRRRDQRGQAKVDQARLNLSYTNITAPVAGIVNKKNVEVGANLSAGQDLMTIIPLTNLWVTANFKETQLDHMHACQGVTLKVDAYGGRRFSGSVTQIGGATGSLLSLFPPENATGNYVKVVQRIPVRIDFTNLQQEDGDYVLRPGLSVTPDVHVKGPDVANCPAPAH